MDHHDVRFGGQLPADHSLVRHDNDGRPHPLGRRHRVDGYVDRFEVTRLDDVAIDDMPVQHSIAVQEQRGSRCMPSFTADISDHGSSGSRHLG